MSGISSKAAGSLENRTLYNGIEHNTDLDLNKYDAFYRTLDPQIGRFWQVDPEAESLESYSTYESMGNNPINNSDPLGDFRTWFGAAWHSLWHGGEIGRNVDKEWYVSKRYSSSSEDGSVTVGVKVAYGKGRSAITTMSEDAVAEHESKQYADEMVRQGVWQRFETVQEANEATFKNSVGVLLPNVAKVATIKINFNPIVRKSLTELRQIVGGKNAELLRKLFGSNEKGAQAVLDNIKNVKIPEGLTKETMEAYRELINRVPDTKGVQAMRAKILDALLK